MFTKNKKAKKEKSQKTTRIFHIKRPSTHVKVSLYHITNKKDLFMFKIKVGLKSFQPNSIEKCKHQIGRIVDYLTKSSASFSMFSEKDCGLSNKVTNTINWKGIPNSSMHSIEISSTQSVETSSTHGIKTTSLSGFGRENSLFDVLVCLTKLKEKKKLKTKKEKGKILHFAKQNVTMQKIEEAAPTFGESGFLVKRASNSRSILARQIYLRDSTFYKEGIPRTRVYKLDARGPRLRRRVPCDILQSKILFSAKSKKNGRTANHLLKQEGGDVNKLSNRKKLTSVKGFFGVTPLPTLMKKITTLRSPHIDKKSREQFEWKREKAQIYFHLNSVPQISLVLFILTHSRFPGVEVEIGVESKTYFA